MLQKCLCLGVSAFVLAGCKARLSRTSSQSLAAQIAVTQEEYDRAEKLLNDLVGPKKGYLPFGYLKDGCYARALYMSMVLATERIPSAAVYAIVPPGKPELRAKNGAAVWTNFHVAPMILKGEENAEIIIDPSVSPEKPFLSLAEWLEALQTKEEDLHLKKLQGSTYWPKVVDSTRAGADLPDSVPSSFAEMQPFRFRDIESACGTVAEYIEKVKLQDLSHDELKKRLAEDTASIVSTLQAKGKISGVNGRLGFTCAGFAVNFDGSTNQL